jgi:hypothetical protein
MVIIQPDEFPSIEITKDDNSQTHDTLEGETCPKNEDGQPLATYLGQPEQCVVA